MTSVKKALNLKLSLVFLFLGLVSVILLSACAPRKVVQKETVQEKAVETKIAEPEIITPPQTIITQPPKEAISEKPVREIPVAPPTVVSKASETVSSPPGVVSIEFSDIHFDFDKFYIRDDAKPILEKLALWLRNNPKANVIIEGHCDERGTNQYNLALGERRALAAKEYLVMLGIASSRIDTVTYGEERPLCRKYNEECWQLNRRARFVIHE